MKNIWQLQEAKARLSEIVALCGKKGPQILSVRGTEKAVLISKEDYDRLTQPKESLVEFLKKSPLKGLDLEIERDKSPNRVIKL